MWKNIIQTMIFDRSNPDEITTIDKDGNKLSRLEVIRHDGFIGRDDLAMVNFWGAEGKCVEQRVIVGMASGAVNWNGLEGYFTKAERKEIKAIVMRLKNSPHEEMRRYLRR